MDIAYVKRGSKFLEPCVTSLREAQATFDAGGNVNVTFDDPGGFGKEVLLTIREGDTSFFGTDWEAEDPSFFPARIKAAATALRDCGYSGRFVVGHEDGHLSIRHG